MKWRQIQAKYDSECPTCAEPIEAGEAAMWRKGELVVHPGCEPSGTTGRRPASGAKLSNAVIVARDKTRADLHEMGDALRYDSDSSDAYFAIKLLWQACGSVGTTEAIEDFRTIAATIVRLNAARKTSSP